MKPVWIVLIVTLVLGLGAAAAVGAFTLATSVAESRPAAAKTPERPSDTMACVIAQEVTSKRLKAPATAQFAPCRPPDTVVAIDGDVWTVRTYVDAENALGAMLRAHVSVTLRLEADNETFTLVDLSMVTR